MELSQNAAGNYRFLPGISPYSSGVVADDGFEVVHAYLAEAMPWHEALVGARRYVESLGRPQQAICGVELRCPKPHTLEGFISYNNEYRAVLTEWDMIIDGVNPVARTNVSPVIGPPAETVMHGFSFTRPADVGRSTFVIAGGGELLAGGLESRFIVRQGETSPNAMLDKTKAVAMIMNQRLGALGAANRLLTTVDVYSSHPLQEGLEQVIAQEIPAAASVGVRWFYSRPPIEDIEFEMDMRGVVNDIIVQL